jgi:membrane fusion protein (multidrug efflux system)
VIDPKPLAAQAAALEADLVRAQAQKAQSDREVARLKPLAEKRAVGQKEADDAMSNAELAAASVKAAQVNFDEVEPSEGYTRVVAPMRLPVRRSPRAASSRPTIRC